MLRVIFTLFFATVTFLFGVNEKITIKDLNNLSVIKESGLDAKRFQVHDGMIYVEAIPFSAPNERVEFFLSPNFEYIILGQGIKADTKERLSFPIDVELLKGKEAFTYGNGKTHYYLFTDPECPYCRKFDLVMKDFKESSTFHVYFFPLQKHTNAPKMIDYIMDAKSADEKFERMYKIADGDTTYQKALISIESKTKTAQMIKMHQKIGHTIKIEGVPSLFSNLGYTVPWSNLQP